MKTSANRTLLAVSLLLAAISAQAEWRTYAGGFSSRWKTVGPHGHDQPFCADPKWTFFPNGSILVEYPNCNPSDFARGNLDNSIGFRAGRERDFLAAGVLRVVGGAEGSVSFTEYNLTQRDFALFSGALTAGADLAFGGVRVGGRYGAGPFGTSDGNQYGIGDFKELALTLPLRNGAALRISQRHTEALRVRESQGLYGDAQGTPERHPGSPSAVETSVMFVASPEPAGRSRWEFASAAGTTDPGFGLGGDRKLRSVPFTRFTVFRDLNTEHLQLEVSWTAAAHESVLPTEFRGYDGNFRSKTIDGFGIGVSQTRPIFRLLSMRLGAGLEVADWSDEHQLLTRDGRELVAGIETALGASAALRFHVAPFVALEGSLQKLYWQRIDLSEARWSVGIVLTR
jgi:hypothetical protein